MAGDVEWPADWRDIGFGSLGHRGVSAGKATG